MDAAKHSMGMEISDIDLINIDSFSSRVVSLTEVCDVILAWVSDVIVAEVSDILVEGLGL